MFKSFVLNLIRFYQRIFSPDHGVLKIFGEAACRFRPTCSEYTYQAIKCYGLGKGILLGLKRIIRCHPFSKGGYDPIPSLSNNAKGSKHSKS